MALHLSILLTVALVTTLSALSQDAVPVSIVLIVRHKTDILPYILGSLDRLTYPKNEINMWIRLVHDDIETRDMIEDWEDNVRGYYRSFEFRLSFSPDGCNVTTDDPECTSHLLALTQKGINHARRDRSEFVLVLQDDLFLSYNPLLEHLIEKFSEHRAMIIAPMLEVPRKFFSNFWVDIGATGGYKSSEQYYMINDKDQVGVFHVKVVHSIWMLDLRMKGSLLDLTKPFPTGVYANSFVDAPVQIAYWVEQLGERLMVSNMEEFGFMTLPRDWYETDTEYEEAIEDILTRLTFGKKYIVSDYLKPKQSKLSAYFDKVYVINLKRRPAKRASAINMLYKLGFTNAEIVDAVDGQELSAAELQRDGVSILPEYDDPYRGGTMKPGEVACFLSHYNIWKQALAEKFDRILILEDDFSPVNNIERLNDTWLKSEREINMLNGDWDLLYLGRRYSRDTHDKNIPGLSNIVYAGCSHWTVGYALTSRGIRKLVDSKPLEKMVPADEILPILSGVHPRSDWSSAFPRRDMVALSVEPLIIQPRHFSADSEFYVSDTEGVGLGYTHDEL